MITPNVDNTSVVDGYGHYSKYSIGISPSISFDSSGASMSISPTVNLSNAPSTHVQLR